MVTNDLNRTYLKTGHDPLFCQSLPSSFQKIFESDIAFSLNVLCCLWHRSLNRWMIIVDRMKFQNNVTSQSRNRFWCDSDVNLDSDSVGKLLAPPETCWMHYLTCSRNIMSAVYWTKWNSEHIVGNLWKWKIYSFDASTRADEISIFRRCEKLLALNIMFSSSELSSYFLFAMYSNYIL